MEVSVLERGEKHICIYIYTSIQIPNSFSKSNLQLSQPRPKLYDQVPAQVLVDTSNGVAVALVQLVPFQDLASKLCEASRRLRVDGPLCDSERW